MWFGLLVAAILGAGPAAAAELSARIDRDVVTPGGQVVLTVTLSGEGNDLPTPVMPEIPGAVVNTGGSSQNLQIINGAVSSSVSWTYYLRITSDENVTVPALEVEVDGRTVRSEPLVIRVDASATTPGANRSQNDAPAATDDDRPGPGDDHFVTLDVDRGSAYVGEQIVLTFRYYANPFARGLDRPQYAPPRTEGFWREELPPNRNYQDVLGGQRYEITEIRYALFPTRPGRLTIEPARVTLPVDRFADFFSSRRSRSNSAPRELETRTLQVDVLPLPEPRPDGFSGVVSRRVDLTVDVSPDTLPRGEPATLSLSLGADGSLKSLSSLEWTPGEDIQTHEAGDELTTRTDHGRLFSRFSLERVLVPIEEGDLELPPVEVVYFDPASKSYETVRRDPGTLTVTPGDRPVAGDSPSRVLRAEIERLADDLRFVHPALHDPRTRRVPLAATPLWWILLLLPGAGLLLLRTFLSREAARRRDPVGTRRREAWRRARARLREITRGRTTTGAGAEIVQAIYGYVADRTGRAAAGLTTADLRAFTASVGRDELGDRLVGLIGRCEAARYGGAGDEIPDRDLAAEAESLLAELETVMRASNGSVLRSLGPVLLLPLALAAAVSAQAQAPRPGADPSRLAAEGVEAYTAGDLDQAVSRFEAAAATTHDADVYYNLGNAHARRGELGRAVLNYLRASRLAPRDEDIRANLDWVRSHTRDIGLEGAPPPGGLRHLGAVLGALSLDELAVLLVVMVWLAALCVASTWWRGGWTTGRRRCGLALGGALILFGVLFARRWYDERVKDVAVVIVDEAEVRSGPETSFPVVFEVHDGLTLQVRARRDDWSQVTLGGEWNGWLPSAALAHVDADRDLSPGVSPREIEP